MLLTLWEFVGITLNWFNCSFTGRNALVSANSDVIYWPITVLMSFRRQCVLYSALSPAVPFIVFTVRAAEGALISAYMPVG